jgi:hypothetical protein
LFDPGFFLAAVDDAAEAMDDEEGNESPCVAAMSGRIVLFKFIGEETHSSKQSNQLH